MSDNYKNGDRVVALVDLGRGVRSGTEGIVTHVSIHHGLLEVRFENGAEISAIRLDQVRHD